MLSNNNKSYFTLALGKIHLHNSKQTIKTPLCFYTMATKCYMAWCGNMENWTDLQELQAPSKQHGKDE